MDITWICSHLSSTLCDGILRLTPQKERVLLLRGYRTYTASCFGDHKNGKACRFPVRQTKNNILIFERRQNYAYYFRSCRNTARILCRGSDPRCLSVPCKQRREKSAKEQEKVIDKSTFFQF